MIFGIQLGTFIVLLQRFGLAFLFSSITILGYYSFRETLNLLDARSSLYINFISNNQPYFDFGILVVSYLLIPGLLLVKPAIQALKEKHET